jgi:hypothetical protein
MNKDILQKSVLLGVITGLIYVVLLLIQNMFCASNLTLFSVMKTVSYLVIIGMFVYTALNARKMNGGVITMQEAFGAIFIVILIAELFYAVFSTIYVKVIDPQFIEKMTTASLEMMEKAGLPQEKLDEMSNTMEQTKSKSMSIGSQIQSYLFSVIIDSIIAFIIAASIKKSKQINFN